MLCTEQNTRKASGVLGQIGWVVISCKVPFLSFFVVPLRMQIIIYSLMQFLAKYFATFSMGLPSMTSCSPKCPFTNSQVACAWSVLSSASLRSLSYLEPPLFPAALPFFPVGPSSPLLAAWEKHTHWPGPKHIPPSLPRLLQPNHHLPRAAAASAASHRCGSGPIGSLRSRQPRAEVCSALLRWLPPPFQRVPARPLAPTRADVVCVDT